MFELRLSKIVFTAFMVLTLAACEAVLAPRAQARYPVEGRLIDIGGRHLQIDCRGSGSPTVILESGGDMFGSLAWRSVQDQIAVNTRVCSYSRAGIMWSDVRSDRLDADGVSRDLHALLVAASESPPYVMVGQSRGGIYNLIFTALYPQEVAALVFVDTSHPEQVERYAREGFEIDDDLQTSVRVALALRWTGLPRLASGRFVLQSAQPGVNEAFEAYFPHSLSGYASEKIALNETRRRANEIRMLGERTVIVLTRQLPTTELQKGDAEARARQEKWEALWRSLHAEIATWSSRGEQRLIPNSDHGMQFSQPQAVVDAVQDATMSVRNSSKESQ